MKSKILIIDDDIDIVDSLKLYLEAQGFEVTGETDPEKAIQIFNELMPDLVILDIMMNEPDEGFFIANKLKKINADCGLIIYSSISKALGYEYGKSDVIAADEFIDKPSDPKLILNAINKILKK